MRRRELQGLLAVSAFALLACGGGEGGGGGGDDDLDENDGGDDAGGRAALVFRVGDETVSELDFAGVPVGQEDAVTVEVVNRGKRATGALTLAVSGDAAFRLEPDSGCAGAVLEPDASCELRLFFASAFEGVQSGALEVEVEPALVTTLQLTGTGVLARDLVVDPASFDFGLVEVGIAARADFRIVNPGAVVATGLRTELTAAGFEVADTTCGAELPPASSCEVTVQLTPQELGASQSSLVVTSSLGDGGAALRATGAGRLTVSAAGQGAGSITSDPAGIDCVGTCTGLFTGPVTLTASTVAGSTFAGWEGDCGHAASCSVDVSTAPGTLAARFDLAPGFASIELAFAGGAPGEVEWEVGPLSDICTGPCNIVLPTGASVTLRALTPATFDGWSGACSGHDPSCVLDVLVGEDLAVTVSFVADDAERARFRLPVATRALAFHPSGDLIVSDGSHVTRVTQGGITVWSAPMPYSPWPATRVAGLDTDAAGNVYVLVEETDGPPGMHLHRLRSADGQEQWAATLAGALTGSDKDFSHFLAVTPTGQAAVLGFVEAAGTSSLRLYNASGTVAWTETGLPFPHAAALSIDSVIHAAVESSIDPDRIQVLRFDLAGEPRAGIEVVAGYASASLAVDSLGFIVASTSGHGQVAVSRTTPTGEDVFVDLADQVDYADHAVDMDSVGNVIAIRDRDSFSPFPGYHLRQLGPTGDLLWEIDKPTQASSASYDGSEAVGIATDSGGRIAVAHTFSAPGLDGDWLTIYQP